MRVTKHGDVLVTQDQTDRLQPYKVRTGCGHIVIRKMRPATAGVAFSEDVILEAPNGAPCNECQKKGA